MVFIFMCNIYIHMYIYINIFCVQTFIVYCCRATSNATTPLNRDTGPLFTEILRTSEQRDDPQEHA